MNFLLASSLYLRLDAWHTAAAAQKSSVDGINVQVWGPISHRDMQTHSGSGGLGVDVLTRLLQ